MLKTWQACVILIMIFDRINEIKRYHAGASDNMPKKNDTLTAAKDKKAMNSIRNMKIFSVK